MSIRVLGCSGSLAAGDRTTSFLLDESVLLDAGSGVGELALEEMARIDDIVLSHSHLDHVLAIALLADSVMRRRMAAARPPIRVHALPETLQALKQHIFNGVIWPDFTRLPTAEQPVLAFVPLAVGQRIVLGRRALEVLPASHSVATVQALRLAPSFWPMACSSCGVEPPVFRKGLRRCRRCPSAVAFFSSCGISRAPSS